MTCIDFAKAKCRPNVHKLLDDCTCFQVGASCMLKLVHVHKCLALESSA